MATRKAKIKAHSSYIYESTLSSLRGVNAIVSDELRKSVRDYYALYKDFMQNMPLSDDEKKTILNNTHANDKDKKVNIPYPKAFNPLGTFKTKLNIVVTPHRGKRAYSTVNFSGPSIIYAEYGTGHLGATKNYTVASGSEGFVVPVGWKYNSGGTVKTDEKTGIEYWRYGMYGRIGNPAGHFIYDGIQQTKRYLREDPVIQLKTVALLKKPLKKSISVIIKSSFGGK